MTTNNYTVYTHGYEKEAKSWNFLEMEINTDVLDKETTYNPLLDGFKSDGSGLGRKDTQALSGKIVNDLRRIIVKAKNFNNDSPADFEIFF